MDGSMRPALFILFALLMTTGQILFKKASMAGGGASWQAIFVNPWMAMAITLYGGATVLWVWLLKSTPLSVAYPYTALSYVLVPLAAIAVFGEVVSWRYAIGGALIVIGILFTSS